VTGTYRAAGGRSRVRGVPVPTGARGAAAGTRCLSTSSAACPGVPDQPRRTSSRLQHSPAASAYLLPVRSSLACPFVL